MNNADYLDDIRMATKDAYERWEAMPRGQATCASAGCRCVYYEADRDVKDCVYPGGPELSPYGPGIGGAIVGAIVASAKGRTQ